MTLLCHTPCILLLCTQDSVKDSHKWMQVANSSQAKHTQTCHVLRQESGSVRLTFGNFCMFEIESTFSSQIHSLSHILSRFLTQIFHHGSMSDSKSEETSQFD